MGVQDRALKLCLISRLYIFPVGCSLCVFLLGATSVLAKGLLPLSIMFLGTFLADRLAPSSLRVLRVFCTQR